MESCDCIISYYNEGLKVLDVVNEILKVKNISNVICVDDGSSNNKITRELQKKYPQVISIRLERNQGKAAAIKAGIKFASSDFVLLIDSDLTNIQINELENAIKKILTNSAIVMIILRRVEDKSAVGWTRDDIIFSGQRILRKSDLKKLFENKVEGYQLEIAINNYIIKNGKTAYWMPFSIHNQPKYYKLGFVVGIKRGFRMFQEIIRYAGIRNFLWQTLFFCRQSAPN